MDVRNDYKWFTERMGWRTKAGRIRHKAEFSLFAFYTSKVVFRHNLLGCLAACLPPLTIVQRLSITNPVCFSCLWNICCAVTKFFLCSVLQQAHCKQWACNFVWAATDNSSLHSISVSMSLLLVTYYQGVCRTCICRN